MGITLSEIVYPPPLPATPLPRKFVFTRTYECDLDGIKVFANVTKSMKSYWISMGPNPMTAYFVGRGKCGHKDIEEENVI